MTARRLGERGARASGAKFLVRTLGPMLLVVMMSELTRARYIHPTYKFGSEALGTDYDDEQLQRHRRQPTYASEADEIARRQDFDNDDGDDDGDQNAAASYQNQDGGGGGGGAGGPNGATDGYDDPEPDGPYEETPVEKDGQADLERFFDDHLGASDRDGMDKENLPSNIVSLLSEPPRTIAASAVRESSPLTVMPMASVVNPIVRPVESPLAAAAAVSAAADLLKATSTIQETSFIRLPDEKMIVTHQVTARNRHAPVRPPLKLLPAASGRRLSDVGGDNEREREADDDLDDGAHLRARNHGQARSAGPRSLFTMTYRPQSRVPVATSHAAIGAGGGASARQATPAERESLAARGSEVITTENDDDDPVYVTHSTDKPFKIDALGGYNPEEDFMDAAKELEVLASNQRTQPNPSNSINNKQLPTSRDHRHLENAQTRLSTREQALRTGTGNQEDPEFARLAAETDISFHVPETDTLYGDASESDEVTFGQDEPYQTDLEAEMRHQQYDKISGANSQGPPAGYSPTTSAESQEGLNKPRAQSDAVVDNGEQVARSDDADKETTDDDSDIEIDNDYKSEPRVEQTETRSMRANSKPKSRAQPKEGLADDTEDEGSWINDGVDEMEIPSQSHQNTVLEKAARQEEAAKKAVEDEEAAAGESQGAKRQPESQGAQSPDEGEESQRMPNADYLKGDAADDDSGYARAA